MSTLSLTQQSIHVDNHITVLSYCFCIYARVFKNAAAPSVCSQSFPSSVSEMAMFSNCDYSWPSCISKMIVSSSIFPSVNEVGLSSMTFASSIVVSVIFTAVASTFITVLVMYFLFIKRSHHKSQNEVSGRKEEEVPQQIAVYEEVGITG